MSKEVVMKSSNQLGVMEILREPLKIFSRNGKLMASITILTLLPYSVLFLGNQFSIQPLIFRFVTNVISLQTKEPGSPEYLKMLSEIKKDVGILVGIELVFMVAFWVVSFLSMVSTVYASAATYSGKNLTLKELLIRIKRTWKNPAITWFYVSLLSIGCSLLILAIVGLFALVASSSIAFVSLALLLVLLVLGISLYLSLVCIVGLVVSVLEDGCYGLEALGKAEELIKGRKLQGYILTLVLTLVLSTISGFLGYEMANTSIKPMVRLALALMLTNITCLSKIYSLMMYTVYYFECKKSHGEEVEVHLGLGYSMVPSFPHVSEALP